MPLPPGYPLAAVASPAAPHGARREDETATGEETLGILKETSDQSSI